MERTLGNLRMGLSKLNQDYILKNDILMIRFGMGAYTSIDTEDLKVFEWCDVQEWAKTIDGIFNQIEKKLKEVYNGNSSN